MTPSKAVRMTIIGDAATWSIILMTLKESFMLLDSIYGTGITHDDCHLQSSHLYSTSHG
jgi:hypothetical protein